MIKASIIENSRKEKTTQVDYNGFIGSCPSGASTGKNETPIFRKKIDTEVKEFNQIAKSLEKIEINKFGDLKLIEEKLKDFGANIIISTEFAILHSKQGYKWINSLIDFPKPLGNVIGGGAHFKGKGTSFQEFLVVDNNSKSFLDSSLTNKKIHLELREELEVYDNKFNGEMTDEGAWAPTQLEDEDVLKIVFNVAKKYNANIGLDIASSQFFKDGKYHYRKNVLTKDEQIDFVNSLIKKYNLFYVEDPLDETDFEGFSYIHKKGLIVGDDLTCTKKELLQKAVHYNSINSLIIKPNQVGSLVKMKETVEYAQANKIKTVFSHRSGETMDTALSHLALGFNADFLKVSVLGKEREANIKEIIKIEKSFS